MSDVMRHATSFSCPSGISAGVGVGWGVGWGGEGVLGEGGGGLGRELESKNMSLESE